MAKTANKGSFPKGKSGNPKGRPPETQAEFVALYRDLTPLARDVVEKALRGKDVPWAVRLKAVELVNARSWGEPTKPLKLEGDAGDGKLELRFVVAPPPETPPK